MRDAGEEGRVQAVVERDDHGTLRAGHEIHMRRVGAHAAVHAVALAEQRRPDDAGQRAARRGAVRQRDVVFAGGVLRDDDALAREAIDRRRMHRRRRPARLAVAGEERGHCCCPRSQVRQPQECVIPQIARIAKI